MNVKKMDCENLLKYAPEPVIIANSNGEILEKNEAFRNLMDFINDGNNNNLTLQNIIIFKNKKLHKKDLDPFLNELKNSKKCVEFNIEISKKKSLDVEGFAIPLKVNNESQTFIIFFRIFNDQRISQEKLNKSMEELDKLSESLPEYRFWNLLQNKTSSELIEKSQQEYEILFQEAPIGLLNSNKEGFIININKEALGIFGLENLTHEVDRLNILYDDPFKLSGISDIFARCINSKEIIEAEARMMLESKHPKILKLKLVPSINKKQDITNILSVIIEITDYKKKQNLIKKKVKLERLISLISSRFLKELDIDAIINESLKDIGSFSGTSRAYLYLIDESKNVMTNSHYWYSPKVDMHQRFVQTVSINDFPWVIQQFQERKALIISDISKLPPEASAIKKFMETQEIKSLIGSPIIIKEDLLGIIGLDNIKKEKKWKSENLLLLRLCSEIVGNALLRQQFSKKLESQVNLRTKELNEALQQQKLYVEEITKASQFKTEFLATMSHELRTPLNAIIGFTDLLLEELYGPLNSEQLSFMKDIKSSAEHQFDMISHILNISKIELGQVVLKPQVISLGEIVNQLVSSIKPLYEKKGINFKVQGLKSNLRIIADPIKLKEILYNLFSNAIKFTKNGKIIFKFSEDVNNWIFSVEDSGIGIAEKDYPIIFKDFKRVDSPIVNSIPGTGLGLSLTKRLVNLHGGNIFFISIIGKGTTFTFTIPKSITTHKLSSEDFLGII